MILEATKQLVSYDLESVLNELRNASLLRDWTAYKKLLEPYFEQDLSGFYEADQAFLNYFLGYYFVHVGKSHNLPNHQERGKDYLTTAIFIFNELGLTDEAIEAEITLGWSYFQTGEIENYEVFLLDALSNCRNKISNAYYSIQVSLLIVYFRDERLDQALKIIDNLSERIHSCSDSRIQCQFFNNSALVYRKTRNYLQAFDFYDQALSIGRKIKNRQFEGLTFNNLTWCYMDAGRFPAALDAVDKAIAIFRSLRHEGYTAESLDSKAVVLKRSGDPEAALTTINAALTYFRLGESYLSLAECLWNKIEILFDLGKKSEIIETFQELSNKTFHSLGVAKQKEFYQRLQTLIIFPFGSTYEQKKAHFNAEVIRDAFENSTGVVEAARKLGFNNHQTLSNLLKKIPKNMIPSKPNKPRADKNEIWHINFKGKITLPSEIDLGAVAYFQCSSKIASEVFDTAESVILLICQTSEVEPGDRVLMQDQFPFIGEVTYEDDNYYIVEMSGKTVSEDTNFLGKILGVAIAADMEQGTLEFNLV